MEHEPVSVEATGLEGSPERVAPDDRRWVRSTVQFLAGQTISLLSTISIFNAGEVTVDASAAPGLVIDDGSTDATPEIARSFKTVRLIQHANHGLSVARNTGISAATASQCATISSSDAPFQAASESSTA